MVVRLEYAASEKESERERGREEEKGIGNRTPIATEREKKRIVRVSCMSLLGDGCLTAIIKQTQM